MTAIYRKFLDGVPYYLARHYWWAYLWRPALWFFDHQPIINAILFGQYKKLMNATLAQLGPVADGRILQLTCVYGCLTAKLLDRIAPQALHITDVARVQLDWVRSKLGHTSRLIASRMNAEQLGYADNTFSTIVLFFLLHEMPPEARQRTLSEAMRVLAVNGTLLVTEYGPTPTGNWLYRCRATRWIIGKLEPFLPSFWQEDLPALLNQVAQVHGKRIELESDMPIFSGFYRVTAFRVRAAGYPSRDS